MPGSIESGQIFMLDYLSRSILRKWKAKQKRIPRKKKKKINKFLKGYEHEEFEYYGISPVVELSVLHYSEADYSLKN